MTQPRWQPERHYPADDRHDPLTLLAALAQLSAREREALIDHRLRGESFQRIARRMRISRARAGQLDQRAIEKLDLIFGIEQQEAA